MLSATMSEVGEKGVEEDADEDEDEDEEAVFTQPQMETLASWT
jgi:hypothetical protein